MKFTFVTLRVSDMEKSLLFYHKLLGMPILEQFTNKFGERITMLGQKDVPHIELIEKKSDPPLYTGISIGFEVENAQEMIQKVKKTFDCIPVGPISPDPSLRFFFIKDPDGYQVQLLENISVT